MNYGYTISWLLDKKEQELDFTDRDKAIKKAEEIASHGYSVYLSHLNADGEEVYYENF